MSKKTTNNSIFRGKLFLSPQHFFILGILKSGRLSVSEIVKIGAYDSADRVNTYGRLDQQLRGLISFDLVERERVYDNHLNKYVYNYQLTESAAEVVLETSDWYRSHSNVVYNNLVDEIEVPTTTSSSIFRDRLFLSPHQFMVSELLSYFESLTVDQIIELGSYGREDRNVSVRIEEQLKRLSDLGVVEETGDEYKLSEYGKSVMYNTIKWFEGNVENSKETDEREYGTEDDGLENRLGI